MKYTKEDLIFTWGVVESKEHAEYIIEVASEAGFSLLKGSNAFGGFFAFSDASLVFIASGCIASWGCKQITIPLPPKEKGWPQVGDEALYTRTFGACNVEVIRQKQPENGSHMSLVLDSNDHPFWVLTSALSKPKSKKDLLIDELHQRLLANNCSDEYLLACDIVQGKVEGLSYG